MKKKAIAKIQGIIDSGNGKIKTTLEKEEDFDESQYQEYIHIQKE